MSFSGTNMSSKAVRRHIVQTPAAPAAIGPYNQAVAIGKNLYISGQLGLDPATMELVAGGVGAQARRALKNMEKILKEANLSMKVSTYLNVFSEIPQFSFMFLGRD